MSRWRAALPRLEKRNGLTPPSVNIQPSCPACDIFHGQNDTYPDLSVHLRRETYVGKRIAKGDGTCGQDRCLGSHGDGRKRSRREATLRVCAVTILVSAMAKYYFEVHRPNFSTTAANSISLPRPRISLPVCVILPHHAVFRDEEGTCPASFPAEKWAWRSNLKAHLS